MKKSHTKLDRERMKKRLLAEEEEKLKATGQESDKKAVKWIEETAKEEEKKRKKEEQFKLELLDKKKRWNSYIYWLCKILHDMILEINLPKSYRWGVYYDGKGVRVFIIPPDGKIRVRAFKPSNDPKYDLNALDVLALWVEDLYDKLQPIWTPKNQTKIN